MLFSRPIEVDLRSAGTFKCDERLYKHIDPPQNTSGQKTAVTEIIAKQSKSF